MAEARWKAFEKKVKAKREVNKREFTGKSSKKEHVDSITVQPRSSDVSVKAQKFSRIGPREFISYPLGDLTLEGIKIACEEHFSPKSNLPETLKCIEDLGQTIEQHTKKVVQTHALAKNIAERFQKKASDIQGFGCTFEYTSSYLGKLDSGEFFTMEQFLNTDFQKHIDNNGLICGDMESELCQKAKCLTHFSHIISSEKLMLLDIEGSDNLLSDPEIASSDLCLADEYLFGAGNLTFSAIENFKVNHVCNKYCRMMGLSCRLEWSSYVKNIRMYMLRNSEKFMLSIGSERRFEVVVYNVLVILFLLC